MTDQTPTPEPDEDDDFPPVRFALRNTNGEAGTITIHQHTLGLDRYVLLQPGDDALELESSHLDFDELGMVLALVLASALQATDNMDPDVRDQIVELINAAVEEDQA